MRSSFVVWFSSAVCVFAVMFAAFGIWIERLGEAPPEQIIERQIRSANTILFASGIDGDFFPYKIALLERSRPDVVALGSSRAMQVRKEFFKDDFANLGGAVTSLLSLDLAVEILSNASKTPNVVVLFADIWWFNGAGESLNERPPSMRPWLRFAPGHIYQAASVLLSNAERTPMLIPPPRDRLGLLGIMDNQGFDQYGSFYYVSTVTGHRSVNDFRLADTEQRIRNGLDRFAHAPRADNSAVERFVRAVQGLQATGMHVVVIFPPFAARMNDLMANVGGYEYVADLFRQLSDRGSPFFDYHDLRSLQGGVANPDCEFVDGLHGGDVAYARLIRDVANRDPVFRATVDIPALETFIGANSGATHGVLRFLRNEQEIDFLGLGCERPRLRLQ